MDILTAIGSSPLLQLGIFVLPAIAVVLFIVSRLKRYVRKTVRNWLLSFAISALVGSPVSAASGFAMLQQPATQMAATWVNGKWTDVNFTHFDIEKLRHGGSVTIKENGRDVTYRLQPNANEFKLIKEG